MPGAPGMLSTAVAAEGHDVDDFLGRDAEDFSDAGGIEDQVVFLGVEDFYVRSDELHHVLVAGNDKDLVVIARLPGGRGFR